MFRAVTCSSSGGQIVLLQPLVSSLSLKSRTVYRLRACSARLMETAYGLKSYIGVWTFFLLIKSTRSLHSPPFLL